MSVRLIVVPYDSALRDVRMGAGPTALLDLGLREAVADVAGGADVVRVEADDTFRAEIRTAFELQRAVAREVRTALDEGAFPLVLSGNCNTAVGTVSALGDDARVFWFDAHGDFNTPETTVGGFLDGMAVAMLTGRCWTQLTKTVPGFRAVPERNVTMIGVRDLDPLEAELLAASGVRRVSAAEIESALREIPRGAPAYVHLDLDVLDPSEGRANQYAVAGGVSLAALIAVIGRIGAHCRIAAAALTAYDPSYDGDWRIGHAAVKVAATIVRSR